jgi:hypothetical protein
MGVAVAADGTVFLANGSDGLRAYTYDGSSFTSMAQAHIEQALAINVAVGPDGTVFLCNYTRGLHAYTYSERAIVDVGHIASPKFSLSHNYPNPFNPTTTIRYQLRVDSEVKLAIYNERGQHLRTLVSHRQPAGHYQVGWDGRDAHGEEVASGIYFYRLETEHFTETQRMILLR